MTAADTHPSRLSATQQRHLYHGLKSIDQLLTEIDAILGHGPARSIFPAYLPDVAAAQRRLLEGNLARLRAELIELLASQGMAPERPSISGLHAVITHLMFAEVAAEELGASHMRGYGRLSTDQERELEGVVSTLRHRIEDTLSALRRRAEEDDLEQRIAALEPSDEAVLLRLLERVTRTSALTEFRGSLAGLLDRLTDQRLEIALFGRVSSGKSSLLNALLGAEVLPTGPTPLTSVVTRVLQHAQPGLEVSFLSSPGQVQRWPLERLRELASERENPENHREVSRLLVRYPSVRLHPGVALVDTPGLGSLHAGSEAETLAYLPRCDVGLLLVDAGSTVSEEEVQLLRHLHHSGVLVQVLLSKSDILRPAEQVQSLTYLREVMAQRVASAISVLAVSARDPALLDEWRQSLQPLYADWRRREQRLLRARLMTLRDAVLLAIDDHSSARDHRRNGHGTDLDRTLREIEADLDRARDAVRSFPAELAGCADEALDRAAEEAARGPDPRPAAGGGTLPVDRIHSVLNEVCRLAARPIFDQTEKIRQQVARASEPALRPQQTMIELVLHDFPIPDIHLGDDRGEMSAMRIPSAALRRWWVRRQLRRQQAVVRKQLERYGMQVREWALETLDRLQQQFSPQAEIGRAFQRRRNGFLPGPVASASARDLDALRAGRFPSGQDEVPSPEEHDDSSDSQPGAVLDGLAG